MKLVPSPQVIRSLANVSRRTVGTGGHRTVDTGCLRTGGHRTVVTSAGRLVAVSSEKRLGRVSLDPVDAFQSSQSSSIATALTSLSEEESAFKQAAGRFAKEKIEPLVKSMDHTGLMDPSLIQALFDNGVRHLA